MTLDGILMLKLCGSLFNCTQRWRYDFVPVYEPKEINRAIRHLQQYPATKPLFPLIHKTTVVLPS